MKICMAGACGRMGRRILDLAAAEPDIEIGGAFDQMSLAGSEIFIGAETSRPRRLKISADGAAEIAKSDVLIDFTVAHACVGNAQLAAKAGKPCVIGTTGLSVEYKAELIELARKVAIVYAPNMSVGVNVLFKIAREVAMTLGLDYNVEITEIHHNLKKDSPSGTALRLAEGIADVLGLDCPGDVAHGRQGMVGERPARQIGIHAIRGGDVVGEHTVCFIGQGERVELTHRAHNRDNFARGALRAARFVISAPPGLYDMQDVLGLK
ncbi:MAG TPA: 4-hydroxy-tetrahydrodipicolinate reductase [Candidatus Hydrogenedentes bacterium]|nr:4-hydroxy-tetrahydrodipicolinate reductase [Candidatus Hydrogenedentota bacterium]HOT49540.1 4-hydroxy-tetrahydrodipicolinate reductase [Candidatus Hydrogenedentota bacterium]HOV74315.1 4-hydroxy-tetrahydrodipicolinate reductase [Candidatus Hydrogenedentota bacterium]HPC14992.1 4-hydroxy-tetrahydrodipicolinate reductase [Candidatus Hydrogenedentota bacterium]HRT19147.1 4-hydroxy-tetrahydrodipicolinate reductase [Candidatus Hydrogenedentota bacterium]